MFDPSHFDSWAETYDSEVLESDNRGTFPFAGYQKLMRVLYRKITKKASSRVLDIGVGTGILSSMLYESGHCITGTDYSKEMLRIAKEKMPNAELIQWDFTEDAPSCIKNRNFDFIISTYALHHLNDDEKLRLISELLTLLDKDGVLYIGDIGFANPEDLQKCKETFCDEWDDELYFVMSEISGHLDCLVKYRQLSHCCVLLELRKISEPSENFISLYIETASVPGVDNEALY